MIHFLKVAAGLHDQQGDTTAGVRDILLEQRGQNEMNEMQGMNPTRAMTKGPTPQNLRNKQWTDATADRGAKGPSHYNAQYVTKSQGAETP